MRRQRSYAQMERMQMLRTRQQAVSRRSQPLITPQCLHVEEADSDGILLRFMFAADGAIYQITAHVEKVEADPAEVPVLIVTKSASGMVNTVPLILKEGSTPIEGEFAVEKGDRLLVRLGDGFKGSVKGVQLAFLYRIGSPVE